MARPSDLPLKIGEVLSGKYQIEEVIGQGGMGVVFGAKHVDLGSAVAVKVMRSEAASSADALARFDREARAAFALRSDHVARVLDAGRTSHGEPYMVMEHLVGQTLGALIRQHGSLPMEDVSIFALEVCDALLEAHGLGIIHRDLKPENIFIVERPGGKSTAKVLDFGIAKVENDALGGKSLTTTGSVLGTPWYMAPEQLDTRRGVTAKTDVWALGATMYHALTSKTPFDAESFYDLSVKVYAHDPTPITKHRHDLPSALVDIVHGCLRKDAKKRFSLQEVMHRLEALIGELAPGAAGDTGNRSRGLMDRLAGRVAPPPATASFHGAGAGEGGNPRHVYTPHTAVISSDDFTTGPTAAMPSTPPPAMHSALASGSGTVNPYVTPQHPVVAPRRSGGLPYVVLAIAAVASATVVATQLMARRSAPITAATATELASAPPPASVDVPSVGPSASTAASSVEPPSTAPTPPPSSSAAPPSPSTTKNRVSGGGHTGRSTGRPTVVAPSASHNQAKESGALTRER